LARRRKRGFPRVALVAIIVVFVGGALILALPSIPQITNIFQAEFTSEFPTGQFNPDYWNLPSSYYFALTEFDGVHCWINLVLIQINEDNSQHILSRDTLGTGISLLELVGVRQTPDETVKSIKVNPKISCQETTSQQHDIRATGGFITMKASVDPRISGQSEVVVFSQTKSIPDLNRNLNVRTGGGVSLPSFTVTADQFESRIVAPDSLATALIDVAFSSSNRASITIDGNIVKSGNIIASSGGLLKFVNPNFGATPPPPDTVKGTIVDLTNININEYHYIGTTGVIPSGVTSGAQVITQNSQMRQTTTGRQDNWTPSEGLPKLQYTTPRGIVVAVIDFTSSGFPKDIGGGFTEFKRVGFNIPVSITDANIGVNKGIWKVEMFQLGRSAFDSIRFVLKDSRESTTEPTPPTTPTCDLPKLVIDGVCQLPDDDPPVQPPTTTCTSSVDLLIIFRDATPEELIKTYMTLKPKADAGTLDQCETNSWILVQAELSRRSINPEEGITTPTGSAKSFIRYENFYVDIEGTVGGGGACPDARGIVPIGGIPIIGFQLIGAGTCDGFRLSQIVLTPTLDFGSNVNNILVDSIQVKQELFLAKNNNFPAQPDILCSGSTATSIGTCAITNYVITQSGIPQVSLTFEEARLVENFVDKAVSGEYEISKVSLQENALIDKVKAKGIALNEGDQLSLMYLIWGKIRGTDNTVSFIRDFEPMTYVQNFDFKAGIDTTCRAPSTEVETCSTLAGGEEQCTIQCIAPIPEPPECKVPPNILLADGRCVPDDPMCIEGEKFNEATNSCEPSVCQANQEVPMCLAGQFHDLSTTEVDDCGDPLIICVGDIVIVNGGDACPNEDEFRDKFDVCVKINPDDMCPEGERRNSQNECEVSPKPVNPTKPTGTNCEEGETFNEGSQMCERDFCKFDASFNLLQCISSVFKGLSELGAPTGQIGGTTLTGIAILGIVIISLIIIAVVVRRRSGGGIRGLGN